LRVCAPLSLFVRIHGLSSQYKISENYDRANGADVATNLRERHASTAPVTLAPARAVLARRTARYIVA